MRCHYAVEFGSQRIETEEGGKRAANLREVFNSPFRPFVLATTSIGQEGLDFHSYCRRIVHWNLPGNPIDLEQREGRINRYKGLVIRRFLARKYRDALSKERSDMSGDIWDRWFELADLHERQARGKCELVPYRHVETDSVKIARVVPMYPYSSDQARLTKILKTLAVYRLAFGQPRQAELVEHLLGHEFSADEMKQILSTLMVDLSPISLDRRN
jgi:helicase-like protein